MQSDWFPSHLLIFLKDTERMRCICLHSLPQTFSNRISLSAACFLFTASNRKTRFPAFSIPNGLVLRGGGGGTSPQNPPQGYTEGKGNKSWSILSPNIPLAGSRGPRQFRGLISCRFQQSGKDRKNYKVASPGSQKSALLVLICAGHPPWHHLSQKEKTLPLSVTLQH